MKYFLFFALLIFSMGAMSYEDCLSEYLKIKEAVSYDKEEEESDQNFSVCVLGED